MHPEVVQKGPGSCPKCGMHLVPLSETKSEEKHSCCQHKDDKEKSDHSHHHMSHEHHHGSEDAEADYTCPMHPDVVQKGPGSCPKCGMFLVPKDNKAEEEHSHDHSKMGHAGMDHGDMDFMSMIDVTKDLPRSGDGLPMEWIDAPFGPFFPGLASGLLLTFTLDGDTIAKSKVSAGTGDKSLLPASPTGTAHFIEHLSQQEPLAPVAYRLLACKALENAAGIEIPDDIARARAGALERERMASHLNWLALFGQQTGFNWLIRRAARLQLIIQQAPVPEIIMQRPALEALIRRLYKTPLLKARMAGIGHLSPDATLRGPVARAAGIGEDARSLDKTWTALGFVPTGRTQSDTLARFYIRLDEILQSLSLIEEAGTITIPELTSMDKVTAKGKASVETARGLARLRVTLEEGKVVAAKLETPSTHHLGLIEPLCDQQELGDALVTIGSLDLSPWEIQP